MDIHFNTEAGSGAAFALVVAQLLDQNKDSFDFRPGLALQLVGGNARGSDRTDYRAVPRLRRLGIEPQRVDKRWVVRVGDLARVLVGGAATPAPALAARANPRGPKRRIAGIAGGAS